MAKGKGGSGKTYVSKGERKSSMRTKEVTSSQKAINQQSAWLKGQNPWITIQNPNKEETNKPYIRVKANTLWGNPKERAKKSFVML